MRLAALLLSVWLIAPPERVWTAPAQAGQDGILQAAARAYQSGDMTAAIRLYREFLNSYPDAAEIRSNLGAALVRDGQFADAISEYSLALQRVPNNPRVRMNLALAYYKLGRLREAVQDLQVLHKLQPLEVKPALLLADCFLETGQPRQAIELLSPLADEYPDDHALVYMLGMALLQENRMQEAQTLLDRILRDGQSAESEYLLGQSEFLRQNMVNSAGHLARAVELNPNLPGVHSLYGQVLQGIGKPDEAAAQFREELRINSYDFAANTETAILLKQDGKPDQALGYIARALQVRPADPGALYLRASIHVTQGLGDEACQELERLVRDYPDFAEAHAALAALYYRMKRTADGDRENATARRVREEAQKALEENRKRQPQAKDEAKL